MQQVYVATVEHPNNGGVFVIGVYSTLARATYELTESLVGDEDAERVVWNDDGTKGVLQYRENGEWRPYEPLTAPIASVTTHQLDA